MNFIGSFRWVGWGVVLVAVLGSLNLQARVVEVHPLAKSSGVEFQLTDGRLRVEFVTDRMVRVRATKNADWALTPSLMRVAVAEKPGAIAVKDLGDAIELRSGKLVVRVDRASEAISYFDPEGRPWLTENPAEPRTLEKVDVIKSVADPASLKKVTTVDGEREVAGKYIQGKDREAWKGKISFRFAEGEALYGLGMDETADLNLRGTTKRIYVHNLRKVNPAMVSTLGYGLLFDAYSAMAFSDGIDGGSLSFDVVDELDYYFIAGPDMDGAVAGYRELTGAAVMLPRWAYGYVQSKERYKSQDEVVATVKEFRDRKIPLDVIVQDWNYWYPGQWGGDPDPKFYPDIAKMVDGVHAQKAHVMISIWPNPSEKSTAGKALKAAGDTLAGTTFVNMLDPKARALYWQTVAWTNLGQYGMDGWWCDSTEPEVGDWRGSRPANADEVNVREMAKIIDPQFLNAYGLEDSKGIYENARKARPERRVLNLTRAGYAGTQRTGSVLWTGDVSASWSTLEKQVAGVQSFSAAGNPYITTDTGGFFVRKGSQWFWNGQYNKGVADLGYRELYTRWLEFEAFLPMFRSHGTDTPREPWRFGDPGTPFYDAIIGTIDLRYRLLPYLYSLGGEVATENAGFLRPVAFAFPNDAKTHDLKRQFLVGRELMAAPVLWPMQYGPNSAPIADAAKTVEVYLPEGSAWVDFWTGEAEAGGRTIQAEAPISHVPLLVKAGSILPLGPRVQYADEQPDAPIELRVYPGADGTFSFYEDAGDGWGYEKGEFSVIPMAWDEKAGRLTIGAVSGGFPGMRTEREFRVELVRPGFGVGMEAEGKPDAVVPYGGKAVTVLLGGK